MSRLDVIRDALPEPARDIRLNLQSVLQPGALTPQQRWGVAVASAYASRNARLLEAVLADARAEVEQPVLDDAQAAAAVMGMNNVYYRFRHMIGKPIYSEKPARLRMNKIAQPSTSKADFELFCLAVSAINGCEACVQSHEKVVVEKGITEDQVHDAVRIAAVIHAAAGALEGAVVASVVQAQSAPEQATNV
jgi:alkyl hydroperoxide reductase subunit D